MAGYGSKQRAARNRLEPDLSGLPRGSIDELPAYIFDEEMVGRIGRAASYASFKRGGNNRGRDEGNQRLMELRSNPDYLRAIAHGAIADSNE